MEVELRGFRPMIGQNRTILLFCWWKWTLCCNFVPGTLKSGMEKNITWFGTAKSAIYPTLKFIELFP